MVTKTIPVLLFGLLGVALAVLVSCAGSGKKDLLSAAEADGLVRSLNRVNARFDNDDCDGAASALASAQLSADSLDPAVDDMLQTRLKQGLDRLRQLLNDQCDQSTSTDTVPTTTTTEKTETTGGETATTETKTTTTETTTSNTETTATETAPQQPTVTDPGSGGIETPPDAGGAAGTN